ncbi:MAG: NAD(+) synthase [Janthinobacterium lividum]
MKPFDSIYTHGFVRACVCVPFLRVADPDYNTQQTLGLARRASEMGAAVALFPELGLSAYSNEDLFHQDALLEASLAALKQVIEASTDLTPLLLVGAPLRFDGQLFNCAVAVYRGQVLGLTPKTYLPNYREFYEKRQFTSGREAISREVTLLGRRVPFGSDLIYTASNIPNFALHTEICEDVWTPIPPSTYGALAGATILANLSASNITIGKAEYRRELCATQSGRCVSAYLYSAAGPGESTTDLAWDGHALIYENNEKLAEAERFSSEEQIIAADLDLERLAQERMRLTSFHDSVGDHLERVRAMRRVEFEFAVPTVAPTPAASSDPSPASGRGVNTENELSASSLPLSHGVGAGVGTQYQGWGPLLRPLERFPYVPNDPAKRDERCYEAYNIQVHGLMKRLQSTGIKKIVIGVSGGLDSTHALIVAARTMDRLGLPRRNILGYTMPGFATSSGTRTNALGLMESLGISSHEIDIKPSCLRMLSDIGHPFIDGEPVYDITFENVQAGERTSHLFRLANFQNGLVLGTGDLSEMALGWATYGVGDQMSHYNVNASVPKTLIQYLLRWVIATEQFDPLTCALVQAIVDTEISPELVPHSVGDSDESPYQSTQDKIGPYELQDFHIYYTTRYGFRPSKVAFLALQAWSDKTTGGWPDPFPEEKRTEYDLPSIKKWLGLFLYRFFQTSQFKRSAMPNGPKVGSGGSLSPRGDWRAPSDSEATVWLEELAKNVPDLIADNEV